MAGPGGLSGLSGLAGLGGRTSVPVAHVQSANGNTSLGSSVAMAVAALAEGNRVLVGARLGREDRTLTPSATGVTFTPLLGPTDHSGAAVSRTYLWLGTVDSGGATSVVVTISDNTSAITCWVAEFDPGSATLDVRGSTTDESVSAGSSADVSTPLAAAAGDLLVANHGFGGSTANRVAGDDFTLAIPGNLTRLGSGQWKVAAAAGDATCPLSWGEASAQDWVAQFVVLEGS